MNVTETNYLYSSLFLDPQEVSLGHFMTCSSFKSSLFGPRTSWYTAGTRGNHSPSSLASFARALVACHRRRTYHTAKQELFSTSDSPPAG